MKGFSGCDDGRKKGEFVKSFRGVPGLLRGGTVRASDWNKGTMIGIGSLTRLCLPRMGTSSIAEQEDPRFWWAEGL